MNTNAGEEIIPNLKLVTVIFFIYVAVFKTEEKKLFLIVGKFGIKTKANHFLVCLSLLSDFSVLSVTLLIPSYFIY